MIEPFLSANVNQPYMPWLHHPFMQLQQHQGHALLLHGPQGAGQFELAALLAQKWLCEGKTTSSLACGQCPSCHYLKSRTHPDLQLLAPQHMRIALQWNEDESSVAAGAKPSKVIKVADARSAIAWSHQTATRGHGKVLIIYPADSLNAESANTLLKTLEEPADGLRIIMCADDPQALMPTLRSRCQLWAMHLPNYQDALEWLGQQGLPNIEIPVLLKAFGGSPMAVLAAHQAGLSAKDWQQLPAMLKHAKPEDIAKYSRWSIPIFIQALQRLCVDLMALHYGGSVRYFDEATLNLGFSIEQLSHWWKELQRAARHQDHPLSAGLLMESLVLSVHKRI
jgi:DNA polymerase-3 subunit delta'